MSARRRHGGRNALLLVAALFALWQAMYWTVGDTALSSPLATLRYGQATLFATYIPTLNGGINHGSTLFVYGSYTFKR